MVAPHNIALVQNMVHNIPEFIKECGTDCQSIQRIEKLAMVISVWAKHSQPTIYGTEWEGSMARDWLGVERM